LSDELLSVWVFRRFGEAIGKKNERLVDEGPECLGQRPNRRGILFGFGFGFGFGLFAIVIIPSLGGFLRVLGIRGNEERDWVQVDGE